MGRMIDLSLDAYIDTTDEMLSDEYRGALAESYVLNELIHQFGEDICYWRNGNEEVDFLVQYRSRIVPVEVKSGRRIRATSLKRYIDEYSPAAAAILSKNPPADTGVMRIPLYMAWSLRARLDNVLRGVTG